MPAPYKPLFRGAKEVLASHRGYDIGALGVALRMASALLLPLIHSTVTRLLIDLNRSLDEHDVFSEFSRDLPVSEHDVLIATYYAPYRQSVERCIASAIVAGHRVLHVGVHSCTDVLNGTQRDLDISWLFDEARSDEHDLCTAWRDGLSHLAPDHRLPFNEPYRGADDGLTTTLRAHFAPCDYLGIEIEVRQSMITTAKAQHATGDLLARSLASLLVPKQRTL